MGFEKTSIPDVLLFTPKVYDDERGFFMETFRADSYAEIGIKQIFVQDNHSRSSQGVLRGLHYQIHQPQGKLVRVVLGNVFDIAVDLRRSSSTFGHWVGAYLSAENKKQIWIPPGFAHGFYTLSDWAEIIYKVTDYYSAEGERSILWNDPEIGINWPDQTKEKLIISQKDMHAPGFLQAEVFE